MLERFEKPKYKVASVHLWADYVELLAARDIDSQISAGQLIDRIWPEARDLVPEEEEPQELEEDIPEAQDAYARKVDDWFRLLKTRALKYDEDYPFELENNLIKVKANLTNKHKVYLVLLCCSHLKYFGTEEPLLTTEFEVLSTMVARKLVPNTAEIFNVGKNNIGGTPRYTGNKYTKLLAMSKDMGATLMTKEDDLPPTDSGDAGMDLLGWQNFPDRGDNKILYVGQAKCSDLWDDGRKDALALLERHFNFNGDPNNFFFIPYCFRTAGFTWARPRSATKIVLVDRLRMLSLLNNDDVTNFVQNYQSLTVTDTLLTQPESVI